MELSVKPRVVIDFKVRQKIMYWVRNTDNEVSGLGKVIIQNGVIKVIDAMLLEQKNTAGSTELDPAAVGKAIYDLREQPGELKFWWHSHAKMGVFWSGTDNDAMKQLGGNGWFLNTVFNHKGESRTAIFMGKPFPIFLDNITLEDEHSIDERDAAEWKAEYDAKVKNTVYAGTGWLSKKARRRAEKASRLAGNSGTTEAPTGTTGGPSGTGGQGTSNPASLASGFNTMENSLRADGFEKGAGGVWHFVGQRGAGAKELPPECILCGFRWQCHCPKPLKETAEALDDLGICWSCSEDFGQCDCTIGDLRVACQGLTRAFHKDGVNLLDAAVPLASDDRPALVALPAPPVNLAGLKA